MLIACWKTNFLRIFMGNFWERNREREIFTLTRFPNKEAKSFTLFCALKQTFFCSSRWLSLRNMQRKSKFAVDQKIKRPCDRNLRFWTLILMFIFREKCQSLEHIKQENLPCSTPLFLVFWPHLNHPKAWNKKICVFMGNEKCLWTP